MTVCTSGQKRPRFDRKRMRCGIMTGAATLATQPPGGAGAAVEALTSSTPRSARTSMLMTGNGRTGAHSHRQPLACQRHDAVEFPPIGSRCEAGRPFEQAPKEGGVFVADLDADIVDAH